MALPSDQFWTDLQVNMTPDTVDIRTTSTLNNFGERTFSGSATTYQAFIRRVEESDRGRIKDDAVADWVVYIPSDTATIAVDDEITLPAPVSGTRPILRVDTKKDAAGQVAVLVFVGQKSRQR